MACHLQGLRGFAVELDPAYCDVILRRFEDLTGEEAVRTDRCEA